MNEITNLFKTQAPVPTFDQIKISIASPRRHPVVVVRRDQEAGDHQLPHVQAGARRPVLRAHLRADQGLRVPVRQVQAHEVQGPDLREVRRRGDARQGAPRAHGPHRARRARRAHLVPEVAALAHRPAARHDAEGSRARPLFRELHRHRARHHRLQGEAAASARSSTTRRSTSTAPDSFTAGIGAEAIREMLIGHGPAEDPRRACARRSPRRRPS